MTDADLAHWEEKCRAGFDIEHDESLALIAEVLRLRAIVEQKRQADEVLLLSIFGEDRPHVCERDDSA